MTDYTYPEAVNRGLMRGATPVTIMGERTSLGAESQYAIWSNGVLHGIPVAGVQMSAVSTSAEDGVAGTGIISLTLVYLDHNLDPHTETKALNGVTPVVFDATDVRFINNCYGADFGSTNLSVGTITVTGGGYTHTIIKPTHTQDFSSFYMVPRGKRLIFIGGTVSSISVNADTQSLIRLVSNYRDGVVRGPADAVAATGPWLYAFASVGVQNSSAPVTFHAVPAFPTGTIVGAVHTSDKACIISANWNGILEGA